MREIAWSGPAPDRELRAALSAAGLAIDREAPEGLPLIVATGTARKVPAPSCDRGRWIWLCGERVGDARAMEAIARGAYDVVSRHVPDAVVTVLRRVDELLTPEPAVQPPDWIATRSAASRAVVEQAA